MHHSSREPDSTAQAPDGSSVQRDVFTLHVGAVLAPEWAEWFDGSEIRAREDGTGLITAAVRDQAMLFGLLLRVRDLRIPLLGLYPGRDLPGAGRTC